MTILSTLRETDKTDLTAVLQEAKDWPEWHHEFLLKADTLGLLSHIKMKTPVIAQPEIPNIARKKYEKKRNTLETSQTIEAQLSDEEGHEDEELIQRKRNDGNWMLSDLTTTGRAIYDADNTFYDRMQKIYEKEALALEKLKNHTLKTVANHYKTTCCLPEHPIWEWYENIKSQCGKASADEKEEARQTYKAALQPLRNPKSAPQWISNWEIAFTRAEQKGVPETKSVSSWASDFLESVSEAFPIWSSTYSITKDDQIKNGTLKFRDLANDFRKTMSKSTPKTGRATKGAFGATYNGEAFEDSDEEHKNGYKKSKQKKVGAKRKSRGENRLEDQLDCPACGQPHPLPKCFYVFPEKAFKGFEPREHITERVKRAMESPALQEQIRALKRGKSRTRTPQPKNEEEPAEIQD